MKIAPLALVAVLAGSTLAALPLAPSTSPISAPAQRAAYTVDTGHSSLLFKIQHNNVSWFYGRFNNFEGTFSIDPANPESGSIDITAQAESVDTGNERRDNHLRSPDFFSAKEFPTISFKSTSVRKTGDNAFEAVGDLSLHGVSKQITVPIEVTGTGTARGREIAGIHSTFTFKRSEFGMNYGVGAALGDEVTIIVSLQGAQR